MDDTYQEASRSANNADTVWVGYDETGYSWVHRWRDILHHPKCLTFPSFDRDTAQGGDFPWYEWNSVHSNEYTKHTVFFEPHAFAMQDELTPEDLVARDIEERCFLGATMLHYACAHDAVNSVKVLCEAGADIDSEWATPNSVAGMQIPPWTPLQIARETSSHRVQAYLMQRAHALCSRECKQAARVLKNKIPKDVLGAVIGPMLFDSKKFEYLLRKRI